MLDAAGGSAAVYGSSSGSALCLHAAAAGLPITRIALWEPPFALEGEGDNGEFLSGLESLNRGSAGCGPPRCSQPDNRRSQPSLAVRCHVLRAGRVPGDLMLQFSSARCALFDNLLKAVKHHLPVGSRVLGFLGTAAVVLS
jgi:hypothetical protein